MENVMEGTENVTTQRVSPTLEWTDADWASHTGMVWEANQTNKRTDGPNNSDMRATINMAQIPAPSDFDKMVEHFGKGIVLGWIRGSNSLRVAAQAVAREVEHKISVQEMRLRVYERIMGIRSARATVVTVEKIVERIVKVRTLPDGSVFDGDDEMEYRQAIVATLTEMGLEFAVAKVAAEKATW